MAMVKVGFCSFFVPDYGFSFPPPFSFKLPALPSLLFLVDLSCPLND